MSDIVILASSLRKASELDIPFVFTDRHAYLATAEFFNELESLDHIDWGILQKKDFKRDPEDPSKFEKYQAEALIHGALPVDALIGVVCHGSEQQTRIGPHLEALKLRIQVTVRPNWYF